MFVGSAFEKPNLYWNMKCNSVLNAVNLCPGYASCV